MRRLSSFYLAVTLLLVANSYLLFLVWELAHTPEIPFSGRLILGVPEDEEDLVSEDSEGDVTARVFSTGTPSLVSDRPENDIDRKHVTAERVGASPAVHIVAEGESLWKIAREHRTTTSILFRLNRLETDQLRPGQRLIIPE